MTKTFPVLLALSALPLAAAEPPSLPQKWEITSDSLEIFADKRIRATGNVDLMVGDCRVAAEEVTVPPSRNHVQAAKTSFVQKGSFWASGGHMGMALPSTEKPTVFFDELGPIPSAAATGVRYRASRDAWLTHIP